MYTKEILTLTIATILGSTFFVSKANAIMVGEDGTVAGGGNVKPPVVIGSTEEDNNNGDFGYILPPTPAPAYDPPAYDPDQYNDQAGDYILDPSLIKVPSQDSNPNTQAGYSGTTSMAPFVDVRSSTTPVRNEQMNSSEAIVGRMMSEGLNENGASSTNNPMAVQTSNAPATVSLNQNDYTAIGSGTSIIDEFNFQN